MDDLLENNKLIAKFMGSIRFCNIHGMEELITPNSITIIPFHDDEIRYDESYDWLMPVVEKISSLTTEDNYNFNFYKVLSLNIDASLNHIYEAVVEFIKWYNENNKK